MKFSQTVLILLIIMNILVSCDSDRDNEDFSTEVETSNTDTGTDSDTGTDPFNDQGCLEDSEDFYLCSVSPTTIAYNGSAPQITLKFNKQIYSPPSTVQDVLTPSNCDNFNLQIRKNGLCHVFSEPLVIDKNLIIKFTYAENGTYRIGFKQIVNKNGSTYTFMSVNGTHIEDYISNFTFTVSGI